MSIWAAPYKTSATEIISKVFVNIPPKLPLQFVHISIRNRSDPLGKIFKR